MSSDRELLETVLRKSRLVNKKKFSTESWNGVCWKGSQKLGQALEQAPQGSGHGPKLSVFKNKREYNISIGRDLQ